MVIKDTNDKDILIAKVTSQPYKTEYDVTIQDWKQAGVLTSSIIRVHKIQTLYSSLNFRTDWKINDNRFKACKTNFCSFRYLAYGYFKV